VDLPCPLLNEFGQAARRLGKEIRRLSAGTAPTNIHYSGVQVI